MVNPSPDHYPVFSPRGQLTPTSAARTTLPGALGRLAALRADASPAAGTVVLLPGYTGSKEDFSPILDPLAAAGFTALALDLPGQFESDGPDDEGAYAPLRLGEVVADVITPLAQRGPVVLLGHSFGGLVARGAVLSGAPVAGLILLCSGPGAFRSGERLRSLRAGEPIIRAHGKAAVYDSTVSTGRAARKTVPADVAELLRRRFLASTRAGLLGMGAALQHEPDRVDELHNRLSARPAPAAVIAGRDDDAWPLTEQRSMAVRLGTELVVIDDTEHSPAVENPAGLLAVLLPLLRAWTGG
jgi:pimeloyl-ACP methyl ester carboxylesterase